MNAAAIYPKPILTPSKIQYPPPPVSSSCESCPPSHFPTDVLIPNHLIRTDTQMLLRGTISMLPHHPLPLRLRPCNHRRRPIEVPATAAATTITNQYSISDSELGSRGFDLHRTKVGLDLDHLNAVFVAVGFPRRDPERIRVALDHTDSVLWVECRETRRPVAFARATGDGVFNAIVWDVVVDPSFQGMGLGTAVMERLVEELLQKGITNIALYSEPRVLGFYRPLGFVSDPDGIRGMVYSKKQKKN